jgi:type VI secretion system secreted protein Hcp
MLVYLFLRVNGAPVAGESPVSSLGREDAIECLQYRSAVARPSAAGSGMASGRRTYEPLVVWKRIDKSSPLLAQALAQNQVVDGAFKFFRQNSIDGTTEHYFTTEISQGRISAITQFLGEGTIEAAKGAYSDGLEPFEEVAFVFNQIEWTYEPVGAAYSDSAAGHSHAKAAAPNGAGSAAPSAAPEPLRPVAEKRPPSRAAAIAPLTTGAARIEWPGGA